jgi:polyamine oxidase
MIDIDDAIGKRYLVSSDGPSQEPTRPTNMKSPHSVIVIGAGSAAVRLAHVLLTESTFPVQVTLLEANDYVGGRVKHRDFEGHVVELGANWISGTDVAFKNPIWKLAQDIQLRGTPSDREDPEKMQVMDCSGKEGAVITEQYLEQVKRFDTAYAKALEKVGSTDSTIAFDQDVDVRSLLEECGWTHKSKLSNIERAVEHNVLEVWVVEDLNKLSAAHDMKPGANDVDLGGDELFVEDPRGFRSIFNAMVKELEDSDAATILLEKEVQCVEYCPGATKVIAKNLKTGEMVEYCADTVVTTVSLGVLQSRCIDFRPPLPKWKIDAFNEIGMFNFGKVYAKFQKGLWPNDKEYVLFVSEGEEKRGYYPLWMRYRYTKDDEHDFFMCYLGGAQIRRVEQLSDEQIKDELEELLSKTFGPSEKCRPVAVAKTDWSTNPRFRGSYSYFPKGAFGGSVTEEDLRRPLNGLDDGAATESMSATIRPPTLYFAGEAFDDTFNGWVQGGYLSGERTARAILQELRDSQAVE